MVVSEAEAELQREVEELKLRLHMAAEHYKEKYRECQRLRRQVAKLSTAESQGAIMVCLKPIKKCFKTQTALLTTSA